MAVGSLSDGSLCHHLSVIVERRENFWQGKVNNALDDVMPRDTLLGTN